LRVEAAEEVLRGLDGGPEGVLAVVRATMGRALRRVTTERGVDPVDLALIAYGGAGPLHAVALARELGCAAAVIPPAPGVLSALGLLLAPPRHESSRTVMASAGAELSEVWSDLEEQAGRALSAQGVSGPITLTRLADCRYAGQSHELRVDGGKALADALHAAHEQAYGYAMPDEPVTVVTVRVVATAPPVLDAPPTEWDQGEARPDRERRIGVGDDMDLVRVLDRAGLHPGDTVRGPALVEQPDSTTLLGPDDVAEVDDTANLVVRLR